MKEKISMADFSAKPKKKKLAMKRGINHQ